EVQSHTDHFKAWRRRNLGSVRSGKRRPDEMELPPSLGLLVVCVIAASRMGIDKSVSANAYYKPLAQLLQLNDLQARRLQDDFFRTEDFWRGLNEFLEAHEGRRGLPTAYALGFRYVGIPQSQAVLRAHDRARLPSFFRKFGLEPRSAVIPADIERLLDLWIGATPCPVSQGLATLWRSGSARDRIAGVASVELAHWDGSFGPDEVAAGVSGEVRLTSVLRQQFGRRSVELSFAARLVTSAAELEISSAEGRPSIGVVPAAGSRVRPRPGSQLDPDSLVGAVLELRDPATSLTAMRRPRRVVPLRRDDLLGLDVEIDSVPLAETVTLLVQDEPRLLASVLSLVESHGRRGAIHRIDAHPDGEPLAGLPAHWVLIEDVQLYAIPAGVERLELQVLVPHTSAQLTLAGGLRLPGRISKWSSLDPPEIRAAVIDAQSMSVRLWEVASERALLEHWTDEVSAMTRPLSGLELADGDYELELEVNGSVVSVRTLRLRSGDSPDVVSWA
ncbi:hypothetical protein, partial [Burkholderia cenocepacia]|uniref:hypothetical protein n=1 Tax=Burkholderia cenocepacia TaxID=95486 RepID=UPI0038CBFE25